MCVKMKGESWWFWSSPFVKEEKFVHRFFDIEKSDVEDLPLAGPDGPASCYSLHGESLALARRALGAGCHRDDGRPGAARAPLEGGAVDAVPCSLG